MNGAARLSELLESLISVEKAAGRKRSSSSGSLDSLALDGVRRSSDVEIEEELIDESVFLGQPRNAPRRSTSGLPLAGAQAFASTTFAAFRSRLKKPVETEEVKPKISAQQEIVAEETHVQRRLSAVVESDCESDEEMYEGKVEESVESVQSTIEEEEQRSTGSKETEENEKEKQKQKQKKPEVKRLLDELVKPSVEETLREDVMTSKLSKRQLSAAVTQRKNYMFVQDYFHNPYDTMSRNAAPVKGGSLKSKYAFLPFAVRTDLLKEVGSRDDPFVVQTEGVVLFVDISGFTALGRKYLEDLGDNHRAADALSTDITTALLELTNICISYGGDVAKFAGDALLCTWEYGESEAKTFAIVRRAAYEMMVAIKKKQDLDLHGGIGCGKILRVYLKEQIQDDLFDCGLRWHLVTGEACLEANKYLSLSEKGSIWYSVNDEHRRSNKVAEQIKLFNRGHGKITLDVDIARSKLFAKSEPEVEEVDWDSLGRKDVEAFIPPVLQRRLDNGAIDGGEIKRITTVFVSLDYLMLTEEERQSSKIGLEKLQKLNDTFTTLNGIVESQKGEIRDLLFDDKGCVFIAVFGALHEESEPIKVLNCVKAARDIATTFTRSKIGVSVGKCFTGMCGSADRHDFVVIGHDVNLAARFMGNARSGQILVSKEVAEETKRHVEYYSHSFKQKGMTYQCYIVNSEVYSLGGRGKEVQCIGRKGELVKLRSLFQQKESNTVVISGREGIGKSTLLQATRARHSDIMKPFHATGFAIEQNSTFYVLQQLLASLVGFDPVTNMSDNEWNDNPSHSHMFTSVNDMASLNATASNENPILSRLRDLKMKCSTCVLTHLLPRQQQNRGRDSMSRMSNMLRRIKPPRISKVERNALVQFFKTLLLKITAALAEEGKKCVLVVENLHWADLNSFKVLVELIKEEIPMVTFLLSTRPTTGIKKDHHSVEMAALMDTLIETKRFQLLHLQNLNKEESRELTTRLIMARDDILKQSKMMELVQMEMRSQKIHKELRTVWGARAQQRRKRSAVPTRIHEEVIDLVYARTEGCPTYLNLLVNYLIEENRVTKKDDCWQFDTQRAKDWAQNYLPPDIESIFRLRTNDLPGLSLKLLKIASVMKREFSMRVLEQAALLDDEKVDEEEIQEAMETLQRHSFVEPVAQATNSNQGRINFRIAKLYNPEDKWRFKSESTQEAMFRCLPKERVEYFCGLVEEARAKM